MTSRLFVPLSRSLHSHSFLHHRIPHGLSAFHRHIVANKFNVAMAANQMSKTLTTASTATAAPEVSFSTSTSSLSPCPALFAVDVIKMDRKELNRLDLRTIPSWARSIVDQERCRRKKQEPQPSKPNTESAAATSIATTATTAATTTAVDAAAIETPAAATTAATVTAAKPTFKLDLPAEKSDIALVEFKDKLLTMDRKDLNMIEMKSTPSWARSLINEERCRRKKMDTIVESGPESLTLSTKAPEGEVATTTTTTTAAVAKSTFKLDLPAEKSDTALAEWKDKIQKMSRKDLSKVDMKVTPTWARRLINEEFCNRKKMKAMVESAPKSLATSAKRTEAKVVAPSAAATTRAATLTTISSSSSDSGSNQGVAKVQKQKKDKEKTEPPRQRAATGDSSSLHDRLVEAAAKKEDTLMWDCSILYDPTLQKSKHLDDDIEQRSRDLFGCFYCTSCRRRGQQRIWGSAEVFTQFWFKYTPANGRPGLKDTLRYQSLIHFQKCRGCEEYMHADLDHESYVKTVIKAFELWTERRKRGYSDNDFDDEEVTKPHDSKRCHGCILGLHRPEDHVQGYSSPYLRKCVPGK